MKNISFLQIFGIILVVIGHSFFEDDFPKLFNWIYNFHMPLFMFISGYLFIYAPEKKGIKLQDVKLGGFITKKIKRLLLPYFVISTLTLFPKAYLSKFSLRPVALSFQSWIEMLIYPGDNVIIYFWFLPTLFIIMLIAIFCIKLTNKLKLKIPFVVILITCIVLHIFNPISHISLFCLSRVVTYLLYFVMGIGLYLYQDSIFSLLKKYLIPILSVSFLLTLIFITFPANDIIKATCGIIFSISLSVIYCKYNLKFLDHLNGSSYAIYLFSWYPQVFVRVALGFLDVDWKISAILSTILGIYIPLIIFKMILVLKSKTKYGNKIAMLLGH